MKKFKVSFRGKRPVTVDEGTTYKEIADRYRDHFEFEPLLGVANNDYVDLGDVIDKSCVVDFFDRSSHPGYETYFRTAKFLLIVAIKDLLGISTDVITEFSIDNGIYCTLKGTILTEKLVEDLEKYMYKLVSEDHKTKKINGQRLEAMKYYKMYNRMDKVESLRYVSNTYITLYKIGGFHDYLYGELAYSSGQIDSFKLTYIDENGFVLSLPTLENPRITKNFKNHKLLFDKFMEYKKWGKLINTSTSADLNKVVREAKVDHLINLAEAFYDSQLTHIVDDIESRNGKVKLVLLAGPSSSGKTTTARKLDIYLRSRGFVTHSISLDDYFIPLAIRPLDKNGNPEFESVRALDAKLFNKNMEDVLAGKKVSLPTYNFATCDREFNGNYLELGEKDVIIVEGLHALNDVLTESIPKSQKYKIFISPLSNLNVDNHNHIHTSDIRKLRRIVRDSKTRGYTASDTLTRWPSIAEGEFENIYRFQDGADTILNSFLIYEFGVLKVYVEPLLYNVDESDVVYAEALRLINLLRNFLPVPSDSIPVNSVLREFIGGSCFSNWEEF